MLVTMKEILERASRENYAVAAPNVDNELNARACIEAAEEMNAPLILDVAFPATVDIFFFGRELRELAIQSKVPIAINLDHGASMEQVMKAIQAGFTSVMIDRSAYSNEKNIEDTKAVVEVAHACGVSVEAEFGHVGQANNYEHDGYSALTVAQEAADFIKATGVDCLAVAIGTAHGAYPKGMKPYIDFDRLNEIKETTGNFPLVLHGSSGTDIELLRKACSMGINKVNVSNDLCQAAVRAVKEGDFDGNKAYFVLTSIKEAIKSKTKELIEIYGSKDKAWEIKQRGLPVYQISGE